MFWSASRWFLAEVLVNQEKIMAAIDDLNAAVQALKDEVAAVGAQMDTLLADLNAAVAANNTAAIAQAASDLQAQVQALKDAAARDVPPATP